MTSSHVRVSIFIASKIEIYGNGFLLLLASIMFWINIVGKFALDDRVEPSWGEEIA